MAQNTNLRSLVEGVVKIKKMCHQLIYDWDIQEYHSLKGTYSSSQFKDLLMDSSVFVKKHIHKTIEREQIDAFDIGTYFHTGVLEPHKLKSDCIVYPGKIRRGKDWEKFKAKHGMKAIVTQSQKDQAEGLVRAVKDLPKAQDYLDGAAEASLVIEINVYQDQIYAPHFGKMLTRNGWEEGPKKRFDKAYVIFVRVRADMLGEYYISDLKSTTGNAHSNTEMRNKISYYHYDLSASLYLDMFGLLMPALQEFIWIFASKDYYNARTYRASPDNIKVGRAKYMKAIKRMAECAANNWESVDFVDTLEPLPHELEWLHERDADLL